MGSKGGSFLAPGFRFHPTDEELVAYYLKRKLLSRPIPAAAIPELDLYGLEPWELRERSPPRDGDAQWYFFCRPDRKRAGGTRTNRATGQGYWKMTGKDREVRNGGRVVGMKKTLVFHAGRAPKGERTNWVMHEYRMADGAITAEGVDQDAYVVCRVFDKSKPVSENGAKSEPPVAVEEPEDHEKILVLCGEDAAGPSVDPEDEQIGLYVEHEQTPCPDAVCLVEFRNGRDIIDRSANSANLLGETHDEPAVNELDRNTYIHKQYSNLNPGENSGSSHCEISIQNNYLELDDLAAPLDAQYPSKGPALSNGQFNDAGQPSGLIELDGADGFFNAGERMVMDEEEFLRDVLNISVDESLNEKQAEDDSTYFDAPSYVPDVVKDAYAETNCIDSLVPAPSLLDPMEELVVYFDAEEGSMEFPVPEDPNPKYKNIDAKTTIDKSDEDYFTQEMYKSHACTYDAKDEADAPSSSGIPFTAAKDDVAADVPYHEEQDKLPKGCLASMLGSIPYPPALAEERSKSARLNGAAQASNSIHVTAGMIRVDGYFMHGSGIQWSSRKAQGISIFLPTYTVGTDILSSFPTLEKMDASWSSWAVRSGFGLCFVSMLFLALICKMGAHMHTR